MRFWFGPGDVSSSRWLSMAVGLLAVAAALYAVLGPHGPFGAPPGSLEWWVGAAVAAVAVVGVTVSALRSR